MWKKLRVVRVVIPVCVAIVLCLAAQTAVAWGGKTHRYVSAYAAYYGDHNSPTVRNNWCTLSDESVTPDTWDQHPYYHAYNVYWECGGAPGQCEKYANKAIDYIAQGETEKAMKNLAWASHYMEDVGNPWHTVFWTNTDDENNNGQYDHYDYEIWVDNNMDSGENFYVAAYYGAVYSDSYASVGDPSDAAIRLAHYSNQYADDVTNNNWKENPGATYNCIWFTSAFTTELYDFVTPNGY